MQSAAGHDERLHDDCANASRCRAWPCFLSPLAELRPAHGQLWIGILLVVLAISSQAQAAVVALCRLGSARCRGELFCGQGVSVYFDYIGDVARLLQHSVRDAAHEGLSAVQVGASCCFPLRCSCHKTTTCWCWCCCCYGLKGITDGM